MVTCISPVDGSVYVERPYADAPGIEKCLGDARAAAGDWKSVSIGDRAALCNALVDAFIAKSAVHAEELAWQMGRPIQYGPGEVRGFEERARCMIDVAADALADYQLPVKEGFTRFIRRTPVGVVLTVAPWNYPLLTAVNSIVPALMAGNAVVLKHSHQTPLCGERLVEAGIKAGLPEGLFQVLHLSREQTSEIIQSPIVGGVAFTGSVSGGAQIEQAAAGRFIPVGLELGGKDPAYVRPDANLDHTIENLVDGSFFNSGQSCCGIERVYVHADVYDRVVDGMVDLTKGYALGNPLDDSTNLGPMVRTSAADFVRGQIDEAVGAGAKSLVDPAGFVANKADSPYLAPHILVDVDHSMRVMSEESFGPVVGVMKVRNDDEAIALMNDSDLGLTASIWSADEDVALALGDRVETGTVFLNRCDYLDPELAWTGVKDTGRGVSLSRFGYDQLTRAKSFHYRTKID
ncbi:MAG: aldehyde dehydrogenase family protein [Candidatus Hydrogenedentota bacterium]